LIKQNALTITSALIPEIYDVQPGYLKSNSETTAVITGINFAAAGLIVELRCKHWEPPFAITSVQVPPTAYTRQSSTQINIVWPNFDTKVVPPGDVCVVMVINGGAADAPYSEFQALTNRLPSSKFLNWTTFQGLGLNTARRGSKGAAASAARNQKFMYVMGGDDGKMCGSYDTVEYSPLDKFGDLLGFSVQQYKFPAPVTFGEVVQVGRFMYYVGGVRKGAGAGCATQSKVFRAEVLHPLQAPTVTVSLEISETGQSGQGFGVYYYRVSALFGPGDPNNPNGESLGGELLTIYLQAGGGTSVTIDLSWNQIPEAIGYNIYRTPGPDMGSKDLRLLATVSGIATTSYQDTLQAVMNPNKAPLYLGETGVWTEITSELATARYGHAAFAVPSHTTPNKWFLEVITGRDALGAGANLLVNHEYMDITISEIDFQGAPLWREKQSYGTFTAGTVQPDVQPPEVPRFMSQGTRIEDRDLNCLSTGDSAVVLGTGYGASAVEKTWKANNIAAGDSGEFTGAWQTKKVNSQSTYGGCLHQAFGIVHNSGGIAGAFDEDWVPTRGTVTKSGSLIASASGYAGLCTDAGNGCPDAYYSCNNFAGEANIGQISRGLQACARQNGLFYQCGGFLDGEDVAPTATCTRVPQ
jgi:hypothetical protein